MRTIRCFTTLLYYDGTQIFEARDAIGGHYVAVMADCGGDAARYLVAGVEPERLRLFRAGLLDLRGLLLERGVEEWFLANAPGGLAEPLALQPQGGALAQSGFLPDAGLVLRGHPAGDPACPVELVGTLEKADVASGQWRLSTAAGAYSGATRVGGPSLAGLTLHYVPYRFSCVEEFGDAGDAGRARGTLYLNGYSTV